VPPHSGEKSIHKVREAGKVINKGYQTQWRLTSLCHRDTCLSYRSPMLSCGHTGGRTEDNEVTPRFGFWFLVGYAATQLATQLQERCIQVVRSNKEAWKRLTESNGTPAMDLGLMNVVLKEYYFYFLFYDCCFEVDICIRRYTNKR